MRKRNQVDTMKEKDDSKTKNTIMTRPNIPRDSELCL